MRLGANDFPPLQHARQTLATALLLASATLAPRAAAAQAGEEAAVIAVAHQLFDGMRARDTARIRSAFDPAGRIIRITREGTVRADSPDGFIRSIASAPAGTVLNERIWDLEVRIDDNVAQLWAKYDFHLGDKFSHCGIDAFQMAKTAAGWKIVQIADTRRTTGCTPPPQG
jgi:hypothetical protein